MMLQTAFRAAVSVSQPDRGAAVPLPAVQSQRERIWPKILTNGSIVARLC